MTMELNLIYARARNGVIGKDGKLPWLLPEDLGHFRAMTLGNVVIMGRKTFESLPGPLGGRTNIVVTRNPSVPLPGANVYRAASIKEALAIAQRVVDMKYAREIWVIGGAEIYKETLPLATNVWVTEIDADFDGDAKMPPLSRLDWKEESRRSQSTSAGISLHFVHYVRRKNPLVLAKNFAKSSSSLLAWLVVVQLVTWSPAILGAFDLISDGTMLVMHTVLATLGAILLIKMATDLYLAGATIVRNSLKPKE